MKTSKLKRILSSAIVAASVIATQAQAGQWCSTKVNDVLVTSPGEVMGHTTMRGEWLQVCNINTTWKGVTPATCAVWVGLLKNAISRKSNMTWYYGEDTPCNLIPYYGFAPAPAYLWLSTN
jgi:hypothetical protein